jgi:hypothetical protein
VAGRSCASQSFRFRSSKLAGANPFDYLAELLARVEG